MREFKLIVAGGRDFTNAQLMADTLVATATELADRSVSIVSGMAMGADKLAHQYAKAHNIQVYEFWPDWDTYANSAGFVRNNEMAKFADGLLAFWNGKSKGTQHMIKTMQSMGKSVGIVHY